ncbi:DUF4232 domain-containing protein [Streptomyces sp. NPDC056390]|uniref:DUF4232 domain-containing protein n=1 Tax=Streptomyces sp. NPDC056390 TaxID=3345806 RepID=UPI0035DC1EB8
MAERLDAPTATSSTGPYEQPQPVMLKPGASASAGLVWRSTAEAGTAVTVPRVRVRAKASADPVVVTPLLDLGTTGKLAVRPWGQRNARAFVWIRLDQRCVVIPKTRRSCAMSCRSRSGGSYRWWK